MFSEASRISSVSCDWVGWHASVKSSSLKRKKSKEPCSQVYKLVIYTASHKKKWLREWMGKNFFTTRNEAATSKSDCFNFLSFYLFIYLFEDGVLWQEISEKNSVLTQLLSAVSFCVFSHKKLWPGCCSALCYYERKKWISNVLPLPAARSLCLFITRHTLRSMSLS